MPRPSYGSGVYAPAEGRKQYNGCVSHIDWHDKEIVVTFYDTLEQATFEWDEFVDFDERLNQWIIMPT